MIFWNSWVSVWKKGQRVKEMEKQRDRVEEVHILLAHEGMHIEQEGTDKMMGQLMFTQWEYSSALHGFIHRYSLKMSNFLMEVWHSGCLYDETQKIQKFYEFFKLLHAANFDIYGTGSVVDRYEL